MEGSNIFNARSQVPELPPFEPRPTSPISWLDEVTIDRSFWSDKTFPSSPATDYSRPITRSISQRIGSKENKLSLDDPSLRTRTVRRAEGKRAGSEASAALRPSSSPAGVSGSPIPSRTMSVGHKTAVPRSSSFSTVRRLFRPRSKSSTLTPGQQAPLSKEVIPEVDEFGRVEASDFGVTSSAPPRERKSSFFFNRSKTPPRNRVDLEGVDVQRVKGAKQQKGETHRKKETAPFVRISRESQVRKSSGSNASKSTPPTTPTLQDTFDTAPSVADNGSSMADRALVLKSLESPSPYGSLRSSKLVSPSNMRRAFDEHMSPPPHADVNMTSTSREDDEGTGLAYSSPTPVTRSTPSTPRANVPRIWQDIEHSPPKESRQQAQGAANTSSGFSRNGRQFASSATSGSVSSYLTATSSPRSRTPAGRAAPKSPLSDLIFNLERTMNSQSDADISGDVDVNNRPALAAGPETLSAETSFRTIRRLEDDDVSLQSSQSSWATHRNTFGGGAILHSPDRWTSHLASSNLRGEVTPTTRRIGDMSMTEIEESVAAVEAALQDHSVEGSFDPVDLRRRILTPRRASAMGPEGVSEEDIFEMLSSSPQPRIRLPPAQEQAIADAIKQVRRAISSSNLPQIADEEGSDTSHARQPDEPTVTQYESTPAKAARVRQESMQDVEQAYARMVDLVGSAAGIDINGLSPLPSARSTFRDSNTPQRDSQGYGNLSYPSPEAKQQAQQQHPSLQYFRERTQSAATAPPSSARCTSLRAARQQLLQESDKLVALGKISRETDPPILRGRTSNISLGSRRIASESPPNRSRDNFESESGSRRLSHQQAQQQQQQQFRRYSRSKRISVEGAGTSPSATAKTQGTPRSIELEHDVSYQPFPQGQTLSEWNQSRFSTSPSSLRPEVGAHGPPGSGWTSEAMHRPQSGTPSSFSHTLLTQTMRSTGKPLNGSFSQSGRYDAPSDQVSQATAALQKRHALERDSLLDVLERSRYEAAALRSKNEELQADLHQEVTRVLELQRQLDRQQEAEQTWRQKVANLEEQVLLEHADRLRIAELLERVQRAVDNAAAAEEEGTMARTASSTSLLQEDLHPASMRLRDTMLDEASNHGYALAPSEFTEGAAGERRSPSLRSYPSALGLAVDDRELTWTLDKEEPLDDYPASAHDSPDESLMPLAMTPKSNASATVTPQTSEASSKRQSYPSPASRLPVPTSVTLSPPRVGAANMSKSTSSTSTATATASAMHGNLRFPSSPPSNRTGLAERFGGSMIGRPRTQKPSGGCSSIASSSSPRSVRNLSNSSSATGGLNSLRFGYPKQSSPASVRKISANSRMTSTTGGDTSYTARTPDTIDVTTMDGALSADDSFP